MAYAPVNGIDCTTSSTAAGRAAPRWGGRFLVPLSADNRAAAGVAAGDDVEVDIQSDGGPREVSVPTDLADALARDDTARASFEGLSYTHRKECVRWFEEAKKADSRAARLAKTVASMGVGTRPH